MKDIIEKLKDDQEYYKGIGRNYLSNSNISQLLTHPKLFKFIRKHVRMVI